MVLSIFFYLFLGRIAIEINILGAVLESGKPSVRQLVVENPFPHGRDVEQNLRNQQS
jgi:hypothetical protein